MVIQVEWGTVVISIAGAGVAIWGGVRYFAKKYVDQHFNEKLENHKHELQQITEFNKFDMQRKFQDFTLFTTKRHEVYVELYDLYLTAEGKARGLMGYRQVPDYKRYNAKELEIELKHKGIHDVKIEQFIAEWDLDKDNRIDDLKEYVRLFEIDNAKNAITAALNKYLVSRLYLLEKVTNSCHELTTALRGYIHDVGDYYDKNFPVEERPRVRKTMADYEGQIDHWLKQLKDQMQIELSVGYYDDPNSDAK